MQDQYQLLQTIYEIVKNDPQPERYACRPRELILRSLQEWSVIQQYLQMLEKEEFVTTHQEDTLVILLTHAGLVKAKEQYRLSRKES